MSLRDVVWQLDGQLLDALTDLGVTLERVDAGAYVATLHGQRRLTTHVWLIVGEQDVTVEAFVFHVVADACPDPSALHRLLLRRNLRLRDVHFAVDDIGDVYLTGSLAHSAATAAGVDRLLGEVWQLLEDDQETLFTAAYGDQWRTQAWLADKVLADGAGRRPAGTPDWAPRRDVRR